MINKSALMATACLASLGGALYGQTPDRTVAFQYFVNDDKPAGNFSFARVESLGMKAAANRPLSATEERQTLQVLGDGTRIDKKEADKYYRDAEGRTRIEREGGATIIISDPVAGFSAEMSTANKTAHKMMVMKSSVRTGSVEAVHAERLDKLKAEMSAGKPLVIAPPGAGGAVFSRGETFTITKDMAEGQRMPTEDLGTQIVNGVPAQGTRSTITIPVGQIGNDREIKVVSERWFSNDLQMLIKSSNNDPRFGETTYQLTNIVQGAQDPSLFQIPADFNTNGPR